MARIQIFEQSCCGPSDGCCTPVSAAGQLAQFLQARPGIQHDIAVVAVTDPLTADGLPEDLAGRVRRGDAAALPAIAVDGRVVHTGPLPNWLQVLGLIEHATRDVAPHR